MAAAAAARGGYGGWWGGEGLDLHVYFFGGRPAVESSTTPPGVCACATARPRGKKRARVCMCVYVRACVPNLYLYCPQPKQRIKDEEELFKQTFKWERNVDVKFEEHWYRDCTAEPLDVGAWGRRIQIFHHNFYGEGLEIAPGKEYTRDASAQPYAGIIWSGAGRLIRSCAARL